MNAVRQPLPATTGDVTLSQPTLFPISRSLPKAKIREYRVNLVQRFANELWSDRANGGVLIFLSLNPRKNLASESLGDRVRTFVAALSHHDASGFVHLEDRDVYGHRRKLHGHGVVWFGLEGHEAMALCRSLAETIGDFYRNHFRPVWGEPGSEHPNEDLRAQLYGPEGVIDYCFKGARPHQSDRLLTTTEIPASAPPPKPRPVPRDKLVTCQHCGAVYACERPNRARYCNSNNGRCRQAARRARLAAPKNTTPSPADSVTTLGAT